MPFVLTKINTKQRLIYPILRWVSLNQRKWVSLRRIFHIDDNYDGKDFVMSQCLFKEDLTQKDDALQIPLNESEGKKICVVYIDIFGNEFKEVIEL